MSKEIKLTKGRVTVVDNDLYPYLSQFKWCFKEKRHGRGYAVRRVNNQIQYMHRLVNDTPDGLFTDHINRDTLDNRKRNLRSVDNSTNLGNMGKTVLNTSGYKGVSWDKNRKKYHAQIKIRGKVLNLGRYNTAEEASMVYEKVANNREAVYAGL